MILSCNSCEKKFVVPDNAISKTGRLVQCSSCGNKWKQFPIAEKQQITPKQTIEENLNKIRPTKKKVSQTNKKKNKKKSGPNLYSPEYLVKKHGIKIDETLVINQKKSNTKTKVNFGFYNFIIVSAIIITFLLRILYFFQEIILAYSPSTEIYINYLFETINNIKLIILNFL